jgi:methylmalonyl-CoA decarboxylase
MSELKVERRDEIAILTLSNPQKRNALDPHLLDALCAALSRLPSEGVRAVVLTGEGDKAFSAGYDITALPDEAAPNDSPLARALDAISDGALPVIAALNGLVIGGGCELAATCDLRVAHPSVTLTMPPVRLGLVYSARGLRRFVALCGASRTRELFLTAEPVDAERALVWGLVDRVVPQEKVLESALSLARSIAKGAPLAVRWTRRVLERLEAPVEAEVAIEIAELQRRAWMSGDAREARRAFKEKRPPKFGGN